MSGDFAGMQREKKKTQITKIQLNQHDEPEKSNVRVVPPKAGLQIGSKASHTTVYATFFRRPAPIYPVVLYQGPSNVILIFEMASSKI